MDKIRDLVLQREPVEELVRVTNEELAGSLEAVKERVRGMDARLREIGTRRRSAEHPAWLKAQKNVHGPPLELFATASAR